MDVIKAIYRNPVWVSAGMIDCELEIKGNWFPFTASADDGEEYGRYLFAKIANKLGPYSAPMGEIIPEGQEQLGAVDVGPNNEGQVNETS
jgi:hypothetical protein